MTFEIDELWSITVSPAGREDPKRKHATGRVYHRDSGKPVGNLFDGFGGYRGLA